MSSFDRVVVEGVAALTEAIDTATHYTCDEADRIARLIRAVGGDYSAAEWLHGHAQADDDGDGDRHGGEDWTEDQALAYVQGL